MNLSSINLRFFANIAPLIGGLNKAERALDQTGRKFESIGKGLTKSFSMPVAALGALSVSVFSGFEQQMAEVKAVSGATADEFQKLKANAEKLGATTIFTAKEVGGLQAEFARLGFTADEITKVTEATLYLAQASGSDLARSAEIAGSTLRAFGMDATETTHVADVMAEAFNKSALDLASFADSMKYVGPVARAAGVSLEEASAMLAVLSNSGIKGSQAGTSLRRILTDLGSESGTTAEKIAKLASKGISMENAMDDVGRTAQSALIVLQNGVTQIDPLTKSFENADGAAKAMALIMGDTLQGSMKGFTSASEGAMIQIGELVSSALRPLVDIATRAISAFNDMNPTIKKLMVGFVLATATIGPAILAVGGLVRTFALLKGVMMAANPALLAVGLAVGVIGAVMMASSSAMEGATGELIRHKTEANSLIAVIGDTNVSQETRNALIDKFNAKFGSYIGNINKEKTSVQDLAKFQKLFNDELSRKIKIAGTEKIMTREMERAAQIQADIIDLEIRRVKAQTDLQKIQAQNDPARTADLELNLMRSIESTTAAIARKTKESEGLVLAVSALAGKLETMNPTMATTATTTTAAGAAAAGAVPKVDKLTDGFLDLNAEVERLASLEKQFNQAMFAEFEGGFKKDLQFLPTMEPIDMEDLVDPEVFVELPAGFAKMSLSVQEFSKNVSAAITGAAIGFTIGVAEMLGSAAAGGEGFRNFGQFALQSLAGLLQSVGEMAIAFGFGMEAIQLALTSLGGVGAIAAGIAMIALASGIRTSLAAKGNSMGGIPALAEGGIATGPTLALIGEGKGPEAVIPLDKLEGMMGGGFGNGQNVVVTGRIQGSDILISSERAERQRSRYRGF
jgi:hypothetical protein